jgi:hypothetical protein
MFVKGIGIPAIDAPLEVPQPPRPLLRQPRLAPLAPPSASRLDRWLGRHKPTTFHRCLAIHIHLAGPRSALF